VRTNICGLLISSVLVVGCQKESSKGGPGVSKDDQNGTNVFTLKVPSTAVQINQGREGKVAVSINRGKTFDQTVKITFDLPKGVEVTPHHAELKTGQAQKEFSFKANKDADVGQHAIKVTGTPERGKPASVNFTLQITKAEPSK
jgi:hypothetical protein